MTIFKPSAATSSTSPLINIKNARGIRNLVWSLAVFTVILFGSSCTLYAQVASPQDSTTDASFVQQNVKISGEFGAYGQLYSISGRPARRPSSTGRIYFSPTLTFFNTFSVPLQFFISSEGAAARQNINQFGISPSWKWGTAHAGDFTENYTDLTLNGITIRGGGVTIQPGSFRFSVLGGITQRASAGNSQNGTGAYRRTLWGGRIGVGKQDKSYIDFIYLKAKDDINSLPESTSSISVLSPNGSESFAIGSVQLIQWASVNSSSTVKIELSRDGGSTFELLFDNQPSSGAVNWTVTGPETFQAVIRVTSDDNPTLSDVSDYPFSIGTGSQGSPSPISQFADNFAATPQENTVLGTAAQIKFPGSHVIISAGLNGSIFTRDLRSTTVNSDSVDIPSFFKGFQELHAGTNADYATNLDAETNFSSFNARIGYKFVGPGYHSPGLSYLISDQQQVSALSSFKISTMRTRLQWTHQNDNLVHQKRYTTARNRYGISIGGMITPSWNSNLSTNIISLQNDASNDTSKVDFSNFGFNIVQSIIVSRDKFVRSLTGSYGYQNSNDDNPLRKLRSIFQTTNISITLGIMDNLSLTPAVGFLYADPGSGSSSLTKTYTLNGNLSALENKLTTSLSLNLSRVEKRSAFRINFNTNYRFTPHDTAIFSISQGSYKGYSLSQGGNFNEFITSLRFNHRF
ncbi:MAG TPA: hypothetical protein VJ964_08440 [Balneolaceae bacterium]|nr:hypothetical protein [Balneolaceae bacterium]